jgi:hypothetical protein
MTIEVNPFNNEQSYTTGNPIEKANLGGFSITYRNPTPDDKAPHTSSVSMILLDPESPISKGLAKIMLQAYEGRSNNTSGSYEIAKIDPKTDQSAGEPLIEHIEKDSVLDLKIKLEKDPGNQEKPLNKWEAESLEEMLSVLAVNTSLSIVSDIYGGKVPVVDYQPLKTAPIKSLLEMISVCYQYNWWRQGEVIELRDRLWYQKASRMIPDEWLDRWRQHYVKDKKLNLDDMAEMTSLTDEQYEANIPNDPVFKNCFTLTNMFSGYRDGLRIYGCLNRAQKAAIFSEEGLILQSLEREQQAFIRQIIDLKKPAFLQENELDDLVLTCKEQSPNYFTFEISKPGKPVSHEIYWIVGVK